MDIAALPALLRCWGMQTGLTAALGSVESLRRPEPELQTDVQGPALHCAIFMDGHERNFLPQTKSFFFQLWRKKKKKNANGSLTSVLI